MSTSLLFLIAAAVCFGLAAVGVSPGGASLVPLGLLLWLAGVHFV
jgi:hypothetical protein